MQHCCMRQASPTFSAQEFPSRYPMVVNHHGIPSNPLRVSSGELPHVLLIAVGSGPIPPWYYNASPGGGIESKMFPPIISRFPWTEVLASVLARFWVNSWPLVAKNPESNQNRRTRTNLGGDVPRTSYAPPKFADDGRRSTNAIHSQHRGDVPRTSYSNPKV